MAETGGAEKEKEKLGMRGHLNSLQLRVMIEKMTLERKNTGESVKENW